MKRSYANVRAVSAIVAALLIFLASAVAQVNGGTVADLYRETFAAGAADWDRYPAGPVWFFATVAQICCAVGFLWTVFDAIRILSGKEAFVAKPLCLSMAFWFLFLIACAQAGYVLGWFTVFALVVSLIALAIFLLFHLLFAGYPDSERLRKFLIFVLISVGFATQGVPCYFETYEPLGLFWIWRTYMQGTETVGYAFYVICTVFFMAQTILCAILWQRSAVALLAPGGKERGRAVIFDLVCLIAAVVQTVGLAALSFVCSMLLNASLLLLPVCLAFFLSLRIGGRKRESLAHSGSEDGGTNCPETDEVKNSGEEIPEND